MDHQKLPNKSHEYKRNVTGNQTQYMQFIDAEVTGTGSNNSSNLRDLTLQK